MEEFALQVGFDDLDLDLLGVEPANVGTEEFVTAVNDFFCQQFAHLGGSAQVVVDDAARQIQVKWSLNATSEDPKEAVLEILRSGQLRRAVPHLWTLIQASPRDPDNYYNMGVACNELGEFEKAKIYLQRAINLAPKYVNAFAALGFAQAKTGENEAAAGTLKTAVSLDPSNVHALKNLGGCLLTLGRFAEAESILRRAIHVAPQDVQCIFGLAQALEELGRVDEADEHYRELTKIGGIHPLVEQAEKARTRFAERTMRQRGGSLRPDVLAFCTAALDLFATLPLEKVQAIGFEIAILGRNGLDINNPEKKYELKEFPGEFSGLKLCVYMYVAFQQISPGTDVGIDFSKEYQAAHEMR